MKTRSLATYLLLAALFTAAIPPAPAAIQYAGGTTVNAVNVAATGTKAELITFIQTQLTNAGWSVVSGGGTTDLLMQSATTPAGLNCRFRFFDNAGNTVVIRGRNVANTKAALFGNFLLPAIGRDYRITANRYQFFISLPGSSLQRGVAMGGVLYVPAFTGTTEAIWQAGNALSDTDAVIETSWKTGLCFSNSYNGAAGTGPNAWWVTNGNQVENNSNNLSAGNVGFISLGMLGGAYLPSALSLFRWVDNSAVLSEPLIGWSTTGISAEAKFQGQIYDAALITESIAGEQALVIDSHNWIAFTSNNLGLANACHKGTLILVTP